MVFLAVIRTISGPQRLHSILGPLAVTVVVFAFGFAVFGVACTAPHAPSAGYARIHIVASVTIVFLGTVLPSVRARSAPRADVVSRPRLAAAPPGARRGKQWDHTDIPRVRPDRGRVPSDGRARAARALPQTCGR